MYSELSRSGDDSAQDLVFGDDNAVAFGAIMRRANVPTLATWHVFALPILSLSTLRSRLVTLYIDAIGRASVVWPFGACLRSVALIY